MSKKPKPYKNVISYQLKQSKNCRIAGNYFNLYKIVYDKGVSKCINTWNGICYSLSDKLTPGKFFGMTNRVM